MENTIQHPWSPLQKGAFRLVFLYLLCYIIPFPMTAIPVFGLALEEGASQGWHLLVAPVSRILLGAPAELNTTGSGDTTWNYVLLAVQLSLAALGVLVWTLIDRCPDRRYSTWQFWLRVFVRYYLAYVLLSYGFFKLIKTQFPFPPLTHLTRPLGEASPMGLAWDFMGYSVGYNWFTGGLEVLGGLLLLFRRTTVLGALVVVGVMSNVVAMNFCFDIPVKLYSTHLLLLAVFLLLPDARRLTRFFLLNQPVEASRTGGRLLPKWKPSVEYGLKAILVACILFSTISTPWQAWTQRSGPQARPPLYGLYTVEYFARNDSVQPPSSTDTRRWKRIVLSEWGRARIDRMDDSAQACTYQTDTSAHTLRLLPRADSLPQTTWQYALLHDAALELRGNMEGDTIVMRLKRFDETAFPLISRGFHWINETPLNR